MFYFASDIHLGAGTHEVQRATEKRFVEWLEFVRQDATAIFLCGDIFDFWYEYKRVVPKGFVRSLAKIAELTEQGIRVVFMAGNHDMWVRDYLTIECGMEIYTSPTTFTLGAKRVHVAHGDNLNVRGNWSLSLMNATFHSRAVRWLFSTFIHPDLALKFGRWWSEKSRHKHVSEDDRERVTGFLRDYALAHYAEHKDDIYVFGHLHYAKIYSLEEQPQMIFMNDWSGTPHYMRLSLEGVALLCAVE